MRERTDNPAVQKFGSTIGVQTTTQDDERFVLGSPLESGTTVSCIIPVPRPLHQTPFVL